MTNQAELKQLEELDQKLELSRQEAKRLESEVLDLFVKLLLDEIIDRQKAEGWLSSKDVIYSSFQSFINGHWDELGPRFNEIDKRVRVLTATTREPYFEFAWRFNDELKRRQIPLSMQPGGNNWRMIQIATVWRSLV